MRVIKVYLPPGKEALFEKFLAQQDPKLRSKIRWTLFRLAQMEHCELKEPHFKHFALEQSINMLADVRRNPDYAVNYDFLEEKKRA